MSIEKDGFIAVGDIHGCSKTLKLLLDRLDNEFGDTRTYVFVGDYVDRGPDSKGVVDLLMNFKKDHDCVFLRGNHDAMLLNYHADKSWVQWFDNGGATTMASYGDDGFDTKIPYSHLKFFASTELYLDTPEYFFVHGGVPVDSTIEAALKDESQYSSFMWRREHIYTKENKWEKTVVFGHTPVRSPIDENNMLGIDTGCVYQQYGKLTAVILPEKDFVQQKNIDF